MTALHPNVGEASHFTGRCLPLTGMTAASVGRNDELHRFYKQPILLGDTFDSANPVTAILAQSFHHCHFISVTL
ncbi:hypothetical protein [Xenorhabdus anantnagensis]|uniref:Uncharacterized protein n=1 Tax=Xenorhabdus anantnagensis TaxID=3025875 RepID=A0ABT5LRC1_9GAMM|nr:hypothetical protein [Xenorhabdus anantnagensis]MDC9596972.1 hypothetical protein [Xenorhabdus anantnagensis]